MLSISLFSLKSIFFTLPIRQICINNIPQPLILHIIILGKKVFFYPDLKCKIIVTMVTTYTKGVGLWQWKPTWAAVTQSSLLLPIRHACARWKEGGTTPVRLGAVQTMLQSCPTDINPAHLPSHRTTVNTRCFHKVKQNYWCAELRVWCCQTVEPVWLLITEVNNGLSWINIAANFIASDYNVYFWHSVKQCRQKWLAVLPSQLFT